MMRIAMHLVRHAPAPKIGWIDQADLNEQLQRAIDGGFVEIGIALADARNDRVGGQVRVAFANDLQNHFALGREAMPGLPQFFEKFGVMHSDSYLQLVASRNIFK